MRLILCHLHAHVGNAANAKTMVMRHRTEKWEWICVPELPSWTFIDAPVLSRMDCTVSPLRPMTWPMSDAGTRHLSCISTGCAACSTAVSYMIKVKSRQHAPAL